MPFVNSELIFSFTYSRKDFGKRTPTGKTVTEVSVNLKQSPVDKVHVRKSIWGGQCLPNYRISFVMVDGTRS